MANTIPLDVIQKCEFGILKYIRDVCNQNNLRYYLAYGTLIGAIRHRGFIPWDDDVDLHMPREDYMQFVKIIQQTPHPYYRLISRETTYKYTYLWPKMIDNRTKLVQKGDYIERVQLGLFVDIFILDGAGNSQLEAEKRYQEAYLLYRHVKGAALKLFSPWEKKINSVSHWLPHIPEKILGIGYWMDRHSAFCLQLSYDECEYVGAMGASTPEASRNIWKREYFGVGTDVVLNGEVFCAPSNWDAVLRSEYGDYMQLPPEEEQRSNHTNTLEFLVPIFNKPE